METRFQTSFIPKKPIVDMPGANLPRKVGVNIFSAVATLLFIVTLFTTGGTYFYKNILKNQTKVADKELNDARGAFETDKIQNLLDASQRLSVVKDILEKHVVVSEVFRLLHTFTVKNIRFDDFAYSNRTGTPTLSMSGESRSYNAIVDQSNIFSKSGFLKDHLFSGFNLSENGVIKMKFFATVLQELVSYKKVVEDVSTDQ